MNSYIKIVLTAFLTIATIFSSSAVDIEKGIYEREKEDRPGIRIYLEANTDEVKDAFEDFLKKNYDFKLKGNGLFANKDELYAKKVMVEKIINKQLNWYTEIIEAPGDATQTRMTIFVSLGYDIYLSQNDYPEAYQKIYDLSIDFLQRFVPEYHKEQIEVTTDAINDLEDDTDDLKKDIAKNEKDIKKLEKEIQEMQASLTEKANQLDELRTKLEAERQVSRKAERDLSRINNRK